MLLWLGMVMLGFSFAIALAAGLHYRQRPLPILTIPADHEITEIRASSASGTWREFEPIPEFVVPRSQISHILAWLRESTYIKERWPLDRLNEWGKVAIRTQDGAEFLPDQMCPWRSLRMQERW